MANKYDPSKLAHHTPHGSKYSQRHPEQGRIEPRAEPVKPEKKRGPQESPAQDFRKAFMVAARQAEWADIPIESRAAFLNVLNEAVMMKATLTTLQHPHGTAEGFGKELCENLFRRTRDHYASSKDAAFGRLLEQAPTPYDLAPDVKATVRQFAATYFNTHGDALKAALTRQYSEGR